jgi:hypothetical protein
VIAGTAVATAAAVVLSEGDPVSAAWPTLTVGAILALGQGRLRWPVLLLVAAAFCGDSPLERPFCGLWDSPLAPVGEWLFENLNKVTDIKFLRFAGIDVLTAVLLVHSLRRRRPGPLGFDALLVISLAGVLGLEVWGLAHGGDFRNSLWQVHQPIFVPLLALLFRRELGPRDHLVLGVTVLGAGVLKSLLGAYFIYDFSVGKPEIPAYATTHSDSVLFATAAVLAIVFWLERRSWGSVLTMMFVLPVLGVGMHVNNRRLVYVAIAGALVTVISVIPRTPLKRAGALLVVLSIPLQIAYLAVGWSSHSGIFKPVQMVRSVVAADADRSSETRDIENYNLSQTLKRAPLLGEGFGHEYLELVRADDISSIFPQYRYIPHNSLLGLWAFGGVVGFAAVWMPLVAGVYLAARAYRRARASLHRAAALTAVSVFVIYAIQAYGDMGFQSWLGTFMVALALAVSANLAQAVGAWPGPPSPAPEVNR